MSVEDKLRGQDEFPIFCYDDALKDKDAIITDLKKVKDLKVYIFKLEK